MAKYTEKSLAQGETTVVRLRRPTLYGNLPSSAAPPLLFSSLVDGVSEGARLTIEHDSVTENEFITTQIDFSENSVSHVLESLKNAGDVVGPDFLPVPYFTAELSSGYLKIVANHAHEIRIVDSVDVDGVRRDARRAFGFHAYPDPRAISRVNDVEGTPPRDAAPTSSETAYITKNEDRTSTSINRLADTLASNIDDLDARARLSSNRRAVCAIGLDENTQTVAKETVENGSVVGFEVSGPLRLKTDASKAKRNLNAADIDSLEALKAFSDFADKIFLLNLDYETQREAFHVAVHSLLTKDGAHLRSVEKLDTPAGYAEDATFDVRGEQSQITQARLSVPGTNAYVQSRNLVHDALTNTFSSAVADGAGTIYGPRLVQVDEEGTLHRYFSFERIDKSTVRLEGITDTLFDLVTKDFVFFCRQGVFDIAQVLPDRTLRLKQYREPGSSFIPDALFNVPTPQEMFELSTTLESCQLLVGGDLPETLEYQISVDPPIHADAYIAQAPRLGITLAEEKGSAHDARHVRIQDTVEFELGEKITLISNPHNQEAGDLPNTTLEALRSNTLASMPGTDALTRAYLRAPDYGTAGLKSNELLTAVIFTSGVKPGATNALTLNENGSHAPIKDDKLWETALDQCTSGGSNRLSRRSLVNYVLVDSVDQGSNEHSAMLAVSEHVRGYFSAENQAHFDSTSANKKRFTRIGVWSLYLLAFVAPEEHVTLSGTVRRADTTDSGVNLFHFKAASDEHAVFDVSHVGQRVVVSGQSGVGLGLAFGTYIITSVPRASEATLSYIDGGPVDSATHAAADTQVSELLPTENAQAASLVFCAGPGAWDAASLVSGSTSPNITRTAELSLRFGRPSSENTDALDDKINLVRTHVPRPEWAEDGTYVSKAAYRTRVRVVSADTTGVVADFADLSAFIEPQRTHQLFSYAASSSAPFAFSNDFVAKLVELGAPDSAAVQAIQAVWVGADKFRSSGVLAGNSNTEYTGFVQSAQSAPLYLRVSHFTGVQQASHNALVGSLLEVSNVLVRPNGEIRATLLPATQSGFTNSLAQTLLAGIPADTLISCSVYAQEMRTGYSRQASNEHWLDVSGGIGTRVNVPQVNAGKANVGDTTGVVLAGAPPVFGSSEQTPELSNLAKVNTYRQVTGAQLTQVEAPTISSLSSDLRATRAAAPTEALRVTSSVSDISADVPKQISDITDIFGGTINAVFDRTTAVRIDRSANEGTLNTQGLTVVRSAAQGEPVGMSVHRQFANGQMPTLSQGAPVDQSLPADGLAAFITRPGETAVHVIGDTNTQGKARIGSDLSHSSYNYFGTGYRLLAGQQDHLNPTKPGRHRNALSEQYSYSVTEGALQSIKDDALPQSLGERGTQLAVEVSANWQTPEIDPRTNDSNYRIDWSPFEIPVPAAANIVISATSTKLPGVNKASIGRTVSIIVMPDGHASSGNDRYYEGWPILTASPDNIYEADIIDVQEELSVENSVEVLRITVTLDSTPEANTATYDAVNAYSSGEYAGIWLAFHGREWVLNARDVNTSGYANWYSNLGILGATIESKDGGITDFRGRPTNYNLNELHIKDWNNVLTDRINYKIGTVQTKRYSDYLGGREFVVGIARTRTEIHGIYTPTRLFDRSCAVGELHQILQHSHAQINMGDQSSGQVYCYFVENSDAGSANAARLPTQTTAVSTTLDFGIFADSRPEDGPPEQFIRRNSLGIYPGFKTSEIPSVVSCANIAYQAGFQDNTQTVNAGVIPTSWPAAMGPDISKLSWKADEIEYHPTSVAHGLDTLAKQAKAALDSQTGQGLSPFEIELVPGQTSPMKALVAKTVTIPSSHKIVIDLPESPMPGEVFTAVIFCGSAHLGNIPEQYADSFNRLVVSSVSGQDEKDAIGTSEWASIPAHDLFYNKQHSTWSWAGTNAPTCFSQTGTSISEGGFTDKVEYEGDGTGYDGARLVPCVLFEPTPIQNITMHRFSTEDDHAGVYEVLKSVSDINVGASPDLTQEVAISKTLQNWAIPTSVFTSWYLLLGYRVTSASGDYTGELVYGRNKNVRVDSDGFPHLAKLTRELGVLYERVSYALSDSREQVDVSLYAGLTSSWLNSAHNYTSISGVATLTPSDGKWRNNIFMNSVLDSFSCNSSQTVPVADSPDRVCLNDRTMRTKELKAAQVEVGPVERVIDVLRSVIFTDKYTAEELRSADFYNTLHIEGENSGFDPADNKRLFSNGHADQPSDSDCIDTSPCFSKNFIEFHSKGAFLKGVPVGNSSGKANPNALSVVNPIPAENLITRTVEPPIPYDSDTLQRDALAMSLLKSNVESMNFIPAYMRPVEAEASSGQVFKVTATSGYFGQWDIEVTRLD